MRLHLILDRIEEGQIAVLTDGDCVSYETGTELLPVGAKEGDAFFGELDCDGHVICLVPCENPNAGKNSKRLRRLFDEYKK